MKDTQPIKKKLRQLFSQQRLGVLATHNQTQPYTSLVAFCATDDLKSLVFATARSTRKYANLKADPHVSMLIDNRSHQEDDFHQAIAVTVTGLAEELTGLEKTTLAALLKEKHPVLNDFYDSPTCALIRINVASYYMVSRFQHVVELHMQP